VPEKQYGFVACIATLTQSIAAAGCEFLIRWRSLRLS
jgi:hypothetical protein